MVWAQLSINRPHLVYIILGGFTSIFMLVSLFIKEKLYIGEATVATICGVIFGPHAADLINPLTWGNTDQITLEFSRIVLVVQCFAVGVELPKAYMERHWRSVVFLLVPVMTFGWLITSLFIWWLVVPLTWLDSLCVAACVTATDPVLASSVVGKGKFAKRVPKHLRDLLSAESGCNDGMAFPFIYLSLYLIKYHLHAGEVTFHWICYTILYECIFGAVFGVAVGYMGRHAIKFAEKKGVIDRESFLVFYFVLALFCAGAGSMLGMDDLLIGFAAGVGFSNDGWFTEKTEESHVSNVIDLLINLAYFVYFGTIIPWDQYNAPEHGLEPWRLVVIAILVIFFRRIPIMLALKPFIPDIKTWREALFAGHFGPVGVGAIFVAILARAELETGGTTPLAILPAPGSVDYELIWAIWPITTFLVIASIVVHGSSIAVFTLGKRINTLTITLTYTQDNDRSSAWMNRLPRISSQGKSMSRMSDEFDSTEKLDLPPGQLPPIGIPKLALRRQKDEDYEKGGLRPVGARPYRRRKKRGDGELGPGGPISQSAIMPARRSDSNLVQQGSEPDLLNEKSGFSSPGDMTQSEKRTEIETLKSDDFDRARPGHMREEELENGSGSPESSDNSPVEVEAYEEGHELIIEDMEGNVLKTVETKGMTEEQKAGIIDGARRKLQKDHSGEYAKHKHAPHEKDEGSEIEEEVKEAAEHPQKSLRKALDGWKGFGWRKGEEGPSNREDKPAERRRGPAHAYQFGNTIIVEDEDGEVIKKYTIPGAEGEGSRRFTYTNEQMRQGLQRMGTWVGLGKQAEHAAAQTAGLETEKMKQYEDNVQSDQPMDEKATAASKTRTRGREGSNADANSDDDGLRLTISRADMYGLTGLQKRKQTEGKDNEAIGLGGGRRMSTKDFIIQMQQLDPKAKVSKVENSDASADIKRDIKNIARREAADRPNARRFESSPGKSAVSRDDQPGDGKVDEFGVPRPAPARSQSEIPVALRPRAKRSNTAESMGSIEEELIPTHDLRSTVARRGQGVTAAEQRRRHISTSKGGDMITERVEEENVDDDDQETPAERRRRLAALGTSSGDDEERETAAEKRRRLAALGVTRGDESDSDGSDEDRPRRLPASTVREPDQDPAPPRSAPKPRIQWGGESGRDKAQREDSESDVGEGTGSKMGKKIKRFLDR